MALEFVPLTKLRPREKEIATRQKTGKRFHAVCAARHHSLKQSTNIDENRSMKKNEEAALNLESPELSSDERAFLNEIPSNGNSETHHSVYRALGWDDLRFWKARDGLVQRGLIKTAPGKLGVAYQRIQVSPLDELSQVDEEIDEAEVQEIIKAPSPSNQLHDYFSSAIEKWALENHFANYFIEVASKLERNVVRFESRPDLVLASLETFQFLPNKYIEVLSYMVRGMHDWSLEAVFETASFARFSNRSFLALQKDIRTGPPAGLEARIEEECRRLGVGLIIFEDPGDYATFQFKVAPQKTFFDPRETDRLLESFSSENRAKLLRWIR